MAPSWLTLYLNRSLNKCLNIKNEDVTTQNPKAKIIRDDEFKMAFVLAYSMFVITFSASLNKHLHRVYNILTLAGFSMMIEARD